MNMNLDAGSNSIPDEPRAESSKTLIQSGPDHQIIHMIHQPKASLWVARGPEPSWQRFGVMIHGMGLLHCATVTHCQHCSVTTTGSDSSPARAVICCSCQLIWSQSTKIAHILFFCFTFYCATTSRNEPHINSNSCFRNDSHDTIDSFWLRNRGLHNRWWRCEKYKTTSGPSD